MREPRSDQRDVGSLAWMKQHKTSPLYFDTGHKKSGKSGARYFKYKAATTVGEYMRLNEQRFWAGDFKHDFARGLLRLLPSAALMSISPGERLMVQRVSKALPPTLSTITECASLWADRVAEASEILGLLSPSAVANVAEWAPSMNPPEPLPN